MKRNDIKKLQETSVEELQTKHAALVREYALSRMHHRSGRLKNVSLLRNLRDDTARVLTILTQKMNVKA
jgi:ribosomal protein L29